MDIINHPLCTATIGAPSDMQDDCGALPVAYRTDEHGTWAVSFWKPEAPDLDALNAGGGIALHVRAPGRQHPAVAMGTYPALLSPVPQVRAAIEVALAESKAGRGTPQDYKLVPLEATPAMQQAALDAGKNFAWSYAACYRAMLAAAPTLPPVTPILKGAGKINGDGWKDTTRMGDVVFVWNEELPKPYAPGQYPRIGNQCGWTASTDQYDFIPASLDEIRSFFDPIEQAATRVQFDFAAHLLRQAEFSFRAFGPGMRTAGICDHIRKELIEIEAAPVDLSEWMDVAILALDGAWRAGATPEQIIEALVAKQAKNEQRNWPDWRTADPAKAIEHDRSGEVAT